MLKLNKINELETNSKTRASNIYLVDNKALVCGGARENELRRAAQGDILFSYDTYESESFVGRGIVAPDRRGWVCESLGVS